MTFRWPFWGRVVLVVIGMGNTVFCTWVLGEASGTQLFLLPCMTLTALLFRRQERAALFGLLALLILVGVALDGRYALSPFVCSGAACSGIVWLNAFSVAVLATGMVSSGDQPTRRSGTPLP
jgi:hypothetical protein